METKENNYKTAVKSAISLFLAYTAIIAFIFITVVLFIKNATSTATSLPLSVVLSLISGILIFYLLHFICRSSTIETFKKEKLNETNSKKFITCMNFFFMICLIFSVTACISYLLINRFIFAQAIIQTHNQYDFIAPELANTIHDYILLEYQKTFLPKLFSTIIIELSLAISFISLIPLQEKLLKKFNKAS